VRIPEMSNLKEGRFTLAHSFRDFSPCSLGLVALGLGSTGYHGRSMEPRKKAGDGGEKGSQYPFLGLTS
jgi:hypothetical protein